ncbi:MAG TPA: MerR family transcriptional regulator [Gaiellaceae bacterium]|nr:MerR family transcriptional regulator [Gaiellaceae bacterium]
MGELLTIGEVARLTTRRPSTIRYYEQIGLLPKAVRVSGRRRYGRDVIRTLAMIETAQRAGGLTLDEIKRLIHAVPSGRSAVRELREIAELKLPAVDAQIERATVVRAWLEAASRCECLDLDECPLFNVTCPLSEDA